MPYTAKAYTLHQIVVMATPLTERLFGLRLSEDVTDSVEYVVDRLRAASPNRLRPVIVGQVNDLVSDAQYLFETQNLHHLPVVSGVKVVGIVSSTDILRLYMDSPLIDPDEVLLEHIMTPNPELIYNDAPIKELVHRLANSAFRCLPVLDRNDELWDIVTTRDLVRFLELVYC